MVTSNSLSRSGVLNMPFTLSHLSQSIRPLEFMVNNDKFSIGFAEATMYSPMVAKGSICKDMNVYPAECRGRRCSYKGRLVVSLRGVLKKRVRGIDFILRHNRLMSAGRSMVFLKASSTSSWVNSPSWWSLNFATCMAWPPKNLLNITKKQRSDVCMSFGMSWDLCWREERTINRLLFFKNHQQEMGGYFIINGIEKVIRMLIMPRRNYPIAMSRPKWKSRGQGYTQYGSLNFLTLHHWILCLNKR